MNDIVFESTDPSCRLKRILSRVRNHPLRFRGVFHLSLCDIEAVLKTSEQIHSFIIASFRRDG